MWSLMVLKTVERFVPTAVTATMQARAIRATSIPYSTRAAPFLSETTPRTLSETTARLSATTFAKDTLLSFYCDFTFRPPEQTCLRARNVLPPQKQRLPTAL